MKALLIAVVAAVLSAAAVAGATGVRSVKLPKLVGLSRSAAEARLEHAGLRYLLPTRRAHRYEAVSPARGPVEPAVPEAQAPDRTVVAQEPLAGSEMERGDFVPFGTILPPGATRRGAYVSPTPVDRMLVANDDRTVTLRFRSLGRRCRPLDHVDVGLDARFVTVIPSLVGTMRSEERCHHLRKRVVRVDLPETVGKRVALDSVPTRPRRGLHRIVRSRFESARGQPGASAVAVYFGHSSDCGLLAGTRVRETRRSVRISLLTGNLGTGDICLLDLIEDVTVVALKRPLGDRRVIDGARSRPARRR